MRIDDLGDLRQCVIVFSAVLIIGHLVNLADGIGKVGVHALQLFALNSSASR
jgi:hypothetical protein